MLLIAKLKNGNHRIEIEFTTDIIEAINQEWISKNKVHKILGFFVAVCSQQGWKPTKNNPSSLVDYKWEHFLQTMGEY